MLSLVLVQLLIAQTPELRGPVAVVITSKRPGAEQVAPKITQRVFDTFKREGVAQLLDDAATSRELKTAGFSDPKSCQGTRACLSKLAILLGPKAVVVGVDVGKVGKALAIHLEAVAADQDASLATLDVSSSLSGWSDAMSAPIVVFVRDVKSGLELPAKGSSGTASTAGSSGTTSGSGSGSGAGSGDAPVRDDPKKGTDLTPRDSGKKDPAQGVVTKPVSKPAPVAAWALAGGAVVTAGAAVGLGIMSGNAKREWDASIIELADGSRGTRLTKAEADDVAFRANGGAGLAITSAVISAGLTAVATILFVSN